MRMLVNMASGRSDEVEPVKFKRKQRSVVWKHFVRKKTHSVCKHCGKTFMYHGGTSNLRSHLKALHSTLWTASLNDDEDGEITNAGTKRIDAYVVNDSRKVCSSARAEAITNLVVDWISVNSRPISIVEDTGLQQLFGYMEPAYSLPSRTHVASIVKKRHILARKSLTNLLEKETHFAAITTDAWTSRAVRSFATYTVHFIDSEWSLQSYVLATRVMDGRHTAVNIVQHLRTVVKEFLPLDKICGVVHDEAANMVAAGRQLYHDLGYQSLVCTAHMLQTCLRHSFDSSQQIQKLLSQVRKLVGHFHHSTLATEALCARQIAHTDASSSSGEQRPVKVIQDVSTRWNSVFYMLQRLVKLKLPIMAVLEDDSVTHKPEHRALLLKDKMWSLAEDLVKVLIPAERATALLGGQNYVTVAFVLPIISSLVKHLQKEEAKFSKEQGSGKQTVKKFCSTLIQELRNKFQLDPINPTGVLALTASLDPRSRGLTCLPNDSSQAALKEELLQQINNLEIVQISDSSTNEAEETNPPPKKKKKNSKDKGYELDFFFGGDSSDKDCPQSVLLQQELNTYFAERPPPADTDPLCWWKTNASRYPYLSILARKFLCIPATSVPSERIFSAAGHIVSKLRASLSPENVDALLFLRQNIELTKPGQITQVAKYSPEVVLPEEIDEVLEYSESEDVYSFEELSVN